MSDEPDMKSGDDRNTFSREIGAKAARKLKARRSSHHGAWFGLGMMGLIGWSVVTPTLLGAALGFWLDTRHAGGFPWTLVLLVVGLSLGCLTAWRWVVKEQKEMQEEQEESDG